MKNFKTTSAFLLVTPLALMLGAVAHAVPSATATVTLIAPSDGTTIVIAPNRGDVTVSCAGEVRYTAQQASYVTNTTLTWTCGTYTVGRRADPNNLVVSPGTPRTVSVNYAASVPPGTYKLVIEGGASQGNVVRSPADVSISKTITFTVVR